MPQLRSLSLPRPPWLAVGRAQVMFLANILTSLVVEVTGVLGGRSQAPEVVDVAVSTYGNARVRVVKARPAAAGAPPQGSSGAAPARLARRPVVTRSDSLRPAPAAEAGLVALAPPPGPPRAAERRAAPPAVRPGGAGAARKGGGPPSARGVGRRRSVVVDGRGVFPGPAERRGGPQGRCARRRRRRAAALGRAPPQPHGARGVPPLPRTTQRR